MRTLHDDLETLVKHVSQLTKQDISDLDVKLVFADELMDCSILEKKMKKRATKKKKSNFKQIMNVETKDITTINSYIKDPHNFYKGRKKTPQFKRVKTLLRSYLVHELVHVVDMNVNGYLKIAKNTIKEMELNKKLYDVYCSIHKDKPSTINEREKQKSKRDLWRTFHKGMSIKTIAESHAEYITDKWLEKIDPKLMLENAQRNKAGHYFEGREMIEFAYLNGKGIKDIYKDVPLKNEFKTPAKYFKRRGWI